MKQASSHLPIEELIALLKNVSIFNQTDESVLRQIATSLQERPAKAGETIFMKGDIGDTMYIIVEGSVRVHDGDHTFATLKKRQVFGEYALLDTEKRSASVTTLEPTLLFALKQEVFYEIFMHNISITRGIIQVLVSRSRLNNKLQEELTQERERIRLQNEQIKQQFEEILTQNEEITKQRNRIGEQKEQLEEKNDLITSSINYAQTIQRALLPKSEKFRKLLPNSFIFYRPKDIVSGDFYWISQIIGKDGSKKIVVASVDCTGHGVPGAFMSCLGISYLDQIVEFQGVSEAGEILDRLNERIRNSLNQTQDSGNQDGMDMSICVIDPEKHQLDFASARSYCFYFENDELQTLKGDSMPIGGFQYVDGNIKFRTQRINYQPGTCFYLFSDGYRDQIGGPRSRKFMMRPFKELLRDIHQLPMEQQCQILEQKHVEWRAKESQTDDIIVIGFTL